MIPAQTPGTRPILTNHTYDNLQQPIKGEDVVSNHGDTHLGDFFFIPPWEYIFGRGVDVDHFADARAEGFVIVEPQQVLQAPPSADIGNMAIIDNYYQPAAVENPVHVLSQPTVIEDYTH